METRMRRRLWFGTILSLVMVFTWVAPHLQAQMTPSEESLIRLQRVTFDPRAGEPPIPTLLRAQVTNGPGIYLMQFDGPVTEAWKAAAVRAGAKLYGYIPDNAFIARLDSSTLSQVRTLPFV